MEASKQEKTDNELIAEFMGGTFYGPNDDPNYANKWWFNPQPHEGYRRDAHHLTIGLRYDKDWSWLMPVIEKINDLGHNGFVRPESKVYKIFDLPIITPIDKVYKAVVEFIKWHNSQKPLPL